MKKIYIKILIAVLILYVAGVGIFSVLTYPNTYVSSEIKGLQRIDKAYIRDYKDRAMLIKGRGDKKVNLTSSNFSYNEVLKEGQSLKQNAFTWPVSVFLRHEYNPEYDITFNKQELEDFLTSSELFKNNSLPENARVDFVDGKLKVINSKPGDTLDKNLLVESVRKSFTDGKTSLELEDEYMKPEIVEDSEAIKTELETMEKVYKVKITYDFGDDKPVLEGEKLMALYSFDGKKYVPNKDKVYEYLKGLAIEYDTFGENQERTFTATGGGEVTVKGGIYGWQMDVEKSTEELIAALNAQESKEMVPVFINEGLKRGKNDIGNTYIEVSLNRQHLWFYKNGELITETDVVTGDPNKGVPTPVGVGKVWSREKDRSLVGIVPQGTADYSSYVDFWMPVTWSGVGIHNSRWRNSFGGSIFNGQGSYGCINLPYEPTKTIYENVEINTPVIIY